MKNPPIFTSNNVNETIKMPKGVDFPGWEQGTKPVLRSPIVCAGTTFLSQLQVPDSGIL